MKRIGILLIGLMVFNSRQSQAQDTDRIIQKGNESYKKKEYPMAEAAYNEVLNQDPNNNTAKYNKAAALYRQTKADESIKVLEDLAFKTEETGLRSKAYYNKGAILSAEKKLEESIEAYKNALRQNPADKEARENLQKALIELKKKNPPKKDDPKKQQKQQQKPQPKMNQKEAEQRLKLLEQKEKEVQERLQKEKSKTGGGQLKDW
ncbi:MAG: tetratricopeptide repeat protein [Chitinophagaceae bacterium]